MPEMWGLALIVTKFALYLSVLTAAGTFFVIVLFKIGGHRKFALLCACCGIVTAGLSFCLQGAMLTGDVSGMTDPEMLELLWSTPIGTAVFYQISGLGLLIFGLSFGSIGSWISAFGGAFAVWSFCKVGHIPGQGSGILNIVLLLHLLAIALWIGVLTPLRHLLAKAQSWPEAYDIGHRFGKVASITVPLLILAGGYMAYVLLGSVTAVLTTGYGRVLLLKIGLVCGLLMLAFVNKMRLMPGLKQGDPQAVKHLRLSIFLEWICVALALGLTAVLTSALNLPNS